MEVLESRCMLTTITVTSLDDDVDALDGRTTLREAILQANGTQAVNGIAPNNNPNEVDIIQFSSDVQDATISLQSALPTITQAASIEADRFSPKDKFVTITHSGVWDGPALHLNISTGSIGLSMTIQGLRINGFTGAAGHAIQVTNLPAQTNLSIFDGTFDNNGGDGVHINLPAVSGADEYGSLTIGNNVITRNAVGIRLNNYDAIFTSLFSISQNKIGTNGTSATDGNRSHGIFISNSESSGSTSNPGIQGNTVSKNGGDGIRLENTTLTNAHIQLFNKIGLDSNGTAILGNMGDGIHLLQSRTTIRSNYIGGNGDDGIAINDSDFVVVTNNFIGTSLLSFPSDFGNAGAGVEILSGSSDGVIGSNFIYYNGGDGVEVSGLTTDRNEITQNNFRGNTGLPIDLLGINGQDSNIPGDTDSGPNDLLNYPEIQASAVTLVGGTWTVPFTYSTDLAGEYRFEFYRFLQSTGSYEFIKSKQTMGAASFADSITLNNTTELNSGDRLAALAVRIATTSGATPNLRNTSEMSPETAPIIAPPRVENVVVKGSTWAPGVEYSFAALVGAGQQLRPISTQYANTIEIHFDGPVSLDQSALQVAKTVRNASNINGAPINSIISGTASGVGYSYDPFNYIARWTFPASGVNSLVDGKYAILLDASAVTGGGRTLDGDWTNQFRFTPTPPPVPALPPTADVYQDDAQRAFIVGNGTEGAEGGYFRLNFALLAGDFNGDGVVTRDPVSGGPLKDLIVAGDQFSDGNGDGLINTTDNSVRNDNATDFLPLRKLHGADFRDDDRIDGSDLYFWRANFATQGSAFTDGDIDGDADVDGADFLLWQILLGSYSAWAEELPSVVAAASLFGDFAPHVLNVIISGSLSLHPSFAFDTVDGSGEQLRTVPVGGADTISIVFNEDVNVSGESLIVVGLRTANLPALAEFSYDSATHTATWRYEGWALGDNYLLALSDKVTDVDGNWLDGEWTNPASLSTVNAAVSEFPSGDGQPGGWFKFVMTLLPGDANVDGVVNSADLSIGLSNFFVMIGQEYWDGDFNGDGAVDSSDLSAILNNFNLNLQVVSLRADFDGDLDVDNADLDVIADNAGMTGATWADGDLDGDGEVTAADLDLAMAQYGWGIDVAG